MEAEQSTAQWEGASRGRGTIRLGSLFLLTALTTLFGLVAVAFLAESFGPTETTTGRVLERSSLEWNNSVCNLTGQPLYRGCAEFTTPAGAVTGEFPDGETWVVVADTTGTNPRDVAGPPGSKIEVTTSNLTGRVTALDNGRSFESTWSRSRSFEFFVVVGAGIVLILAMTIVLVRSRRSGPMFSQVKRPVVAGATVVAIAVGAFAAWWGTIRAYDQYRAPSSTDRYGGFIADPYTHVGSADEAVEAGRVVEVSLEKISVRALEESELSPDVQSVIDGESGSVVAILTEASRTRTQLVLLRVLAELDDGSIMEADACSEYEYPAEVGVDPKVAAGLFCFGTDLDPTATIRVAEGRNGNGLPIAAPLLD